MRALGLSASEEGRVEEALHGLEVSLRFAEEGQRVLVNGEDVTGNIRTPEASRAASDFRLCPVCGAFSLTCSRIWRSTTA